MRVTRRFAIVVFCALAVLPLSVGTSAQALVSVDQGSANLRTIDPATAQTLSTVPMTLAGQTILGANGLAVQPGTGTLFVLLRLQGIAGRVLATVNPTTGVVTQIGNTGDNFSTLAFDCAGNLYGMTGQNANPDETLFQLSTTTGARTLLGPLTASNDGEALGFNPVDNMMYHASGHDGVCDRPNDIGVCFERFNPGTVPPVPVDIPIGTTALINEEAQALAFESSSGMFLWKQNHGTGPLFRVNPTTGATTQVGTLDMDHQAKGLAYLGVAATCGAGNATDFSITTTGLAVPVLTVRPGQSGSFSVLISPIPAGSTFGAQVDVTCSTSPFVGTCSVSPMTIPAGSGATTVIATVTPTIFGAAPPIGGNPILWFWLAVFALSLIAAGVVGRRRVARLGYAVSFGLVLLVVSVAMLQSACAGSDGQRLQGPYQVTVTATSGGVSHSTSATYNVSH